MWLLARELRTAIEAAEASGAVPSAEAQAEYVARYGDYRSDTSRVMRVDGDVATISINGAMTKAPSLLAMIFGGGNITYPEIINALSAADRDDRVKRIDMRIDSGGGHVDGMFDAMAAMQATSKPIRAIGVNTVASAAYGLASQADEIIAANRATRFGSIGVAASYYIDPEVVTLTSTKAPYKRPDLTTEEGQAVERQELDALHEIFIEAIADGRGIETSTIDADYGQGATLLADEALKRGMIDSIIAKPTTAVGGTKPEATMDLQALKAQHPDVFAAAVQEGVTKERDRVAAHLTMGEASGDMATAVAAINDGSEMTAGLQAKYMAAGLNRRDTADREADDAAAAAAANGATRQSAQDDEAAEVAALVRQKFGLTGG